MPNLIHVEIGASQDGKWNGEARPAPEDLSDGIIRLVEEVNDVLTTGRWAILDTGTDRVKWLLYDGAALRHCCRLLYEMEIAVQSGQEFAARLLNRAHLEAWLTGLYIHYGGYEAVARVAQDTRHHLQSAHNEAAEFDKWLAAEKKSARGRARRVERANKRLQQWNEANPQLPAKPLIPPPYIPQLRAVELDLSDRIADFGEHEGRQLPVSDIIDLLTKLAPEKGFGNESFRPIYLIYRVLSSISVHATLNILDSYFMPDGFIRIAPEPVNGSIADNARITALHATAFLACAVLGDQGCSTPVAEELRARLAPDPTGGSVWAPGI